MNTEVRDLEQQLAACAQMRQALEAELAFQSAVAECVNCEPDGDWYCEEHEEEYGHIGRLKRDALATDAGAALLAELAALEAMAAAGREALRVTAYTLVPRQEWDVLRAALAALAQSQQRAQEALQVKDEAKGGEGAGEAPDG